MRLGVSPAATSTSTSVFNQRFEALFPHTVALGCEVCFAPHPFLPVYLCANVVPWGLPAAAWPSPVHNLTPRWVRQLLPCHKSSPPPLPVSTPPTGLDERFFFISLVVRLPCSLIFCQFWLFFVFKLLLSFFWLCEEAQCVYLRLHLGQKTRPSCLDKPLRVTDGERLPRWGGEWHRGTRRGVRTDMQGQQGHRVRVCAGARSCWRQSPD